MNHSIEKSDVLYLEMVSDGLVEVAQKVMCITKVAARPALSRLVSHLRHQR